MLMEFKKIDLRGQRIRVTPPDKKPYSIHVPDQKQLRRKAAITSAMSFFAGNTEQILRVLGGDEAEQSSLMKNDEFCAVLNRVRDAGVGRQKFLHDMSQLIENSPSSPELNVGRACAGQYTAFIYSEITRLKIEQKSLKRR